MEIPHVLERDPEEEALRSQAKVLLHIYPLSFAVILL